MAAVVVGGAILITQGSEEPNLSSPSTSEEMAPSSSPPTFETQPPEEPPEPSSLEVVDYGFSVQTGYGSRTADFAIIVRNPSETLVAEQAAFDVTFLDESGTVIGSVEEFANYVQPNALAAISSTTDLSAPAERVRMQVEPGDVLGWLGDEFPRGQFVVSDSQVDYEFGSPKVTTTIRSTYEEDVSEVLVVGVLYDQSDRIVGGVFSFERLRGGGRTVVTLSGIYQTPNVVRAEVYAAPSNLSSIE